MARKTKTTRAKFPLIVRRNWGFWDGVADRKAGRLAPWYRGAAKDFGHYDPAYAEAYDKAVWDVVTPNAKGWRPEW